MNDFSANEFDRFLSENSVKPSWVQVHPLAWNGYWGLKYRPKKLLRSLGRKLHSKYIYWLGLPVYWIDGLKKYVHVDVAKVTDIVNEYGHSIFVDLEE